MTTFAAELAALRLRAIAHLFDRLPANVEYICFDVDGDEIIGTDMADAGGSACYEYPEPTAFDGINAVFGVRHEALFTYGVARTDMPEAVYKTLHSLPQYTHGRPVVLRRPPRT